MPLPIQKLPPGTKIVATGRNLPNFQMAVEKWNVNYGDIFTVVKDFPARLYVYVEERVRPGDEGKWSRDFFDLHVDLTAGVYDEIMAAQEAMEKVSGQST